MIILCFLYAKLQRLVVDIDIVFPIYATIIIHTN